MDSLDGTGRTGGKTPSMAPANPPHHLQTGRPVVASSTGPVERWPFSNMPVASIDGGILRGGGVVGGCAPATRSCTRSRAGQLTADRLSAARQRRHQPVDHLPLRGFPRPPDPRDPDNLIP